MSRGHPHIPTARCDAGDAVCRAGFALQWIEAAGYFAGNDAGQRRV